jgi:hypothetical protein
VAEVCAAVIFFVSYSAFLLVELVGATGFWDEKKKMRPGKMGLEERTDT